MPARTIGPQHTQVARSKVQRLQLRRLPGRRHQPARQRRRHARAHEARRSSSLFPPAAARAWARHVARRHTAAAHPHLALRPKWQRLDLHDRRGLPARPCV
jgi:hypothetical protein